MAEKIEVEFWVCVDHEGEYRVGVDEESAVTAYKDEFEVTGPIETYQLFIGGVPVPKAKVAKAMLPDDAGQDGVYKLDMRRTDLD